MFRLCAILMVIVPTIVFAEPPMPPILTRVATPPPVFENDCTHFYPAAAGKVGAQGVTVVSVHIAADGTIQSPRVFQTSGNADLDAAALACVSGAHTTPLNSDGAPIEADTEMQIVWQRSYFSGAPSAISRNSCGGWYPPAAVRMHHVGNTALSFTIAENGAVKNVTVTKSSGYDELDQASVACASLWQYWPVTQNGKPVAIDWKAAINWQMSP